MISLVVLIAMVGCAPHRFSRTEKLPDSVLADARPNPADGRLDPAVKPAALNEKDLQGTPTLPPRADADAQATVPSALRETVQLPQRHSADEPPTPALNQALVVADKDRGSRVADMARELEILHPEMVDDFLSETRRAAAAGRLPEVLDVWKVTLDHLGKPSPRRSRIKPAPLQEDVDEGMPPVRRFAKDGAEAPASTLPRRTRGDDERDAPAPIARDRGPEVSRSAKLSGADRPNAEAPIRLPYSEVGPSDPPDPKNRHRDSDVRATSLQGAKDFNERLRDLALALEENQDGDPVQRQVSSRLVSLVAGDSTGAHKPLEGIDGADRQYWQAVINALARQFDKKQSRPESRANQAMESLEEALTALRQRADLQATSPLFCSSVVNFGNYIEFDRYEFKPGQPVVVYWEVKNFSSVESKEGWRTKLSATFEIQDSQGEKRHRFTRDFKDDVCRNRRHDFFNVVVFPLPDNLPPGDYVLKVTTIDKASEKSAEKQTRFVVK